MTPQQATQLAALLRAHRQRLGLSAREVARRAGVDVGTVTRIEKAQIPTPKAENLTAIGDALGIPAADLFAIVNWVPEHELPSFTPYLRAKYKQFPEAAVDEMERFFARLAKKHGVEGPVQGEDER